MKKINVKSTIFEIIEKRMKQIKLEGWKIPNGVVTQKPKINIPLKIKKTIFLCIDKKIV
jgi:hypothetical protein